MIAERSIKTCMDILIAKLLFSWSLIVVIELKKSARRETTD
jgi:hypothetical protein